MRAACGGVYSGSRYASRSMVLLVIRVSGAAAISLAAYRDQQRCRSGTVPLSVNTSCAMWDHYGRASYSRGTVS